MEPINIQNNRMICECAQCSTLVDITPFDESLKYDAEYFCEDCGKVVCESCYGDFRSVQYGDEDCEDIGEVCQSCYEARDGVDTHEAMPDDAASVPAVDGEKAK